MIVAEADRYYFLIPVNKQVVSLDLKQAVLCKYDFF